MSFFFFCLCLEGEVTTLAGGVTSGSADGFGTYANFKLPYGVAVDSSSNLYVADRNNNLIRQISASDGYVSTLAGGIGTGTSNGLGTFARFNLPRGIVVDSLGSRLLIADTSNNVIRSISLTSGYAVDTFAGTMGSVGTSSTTLNYPYGLFLDMNRNLYIADYGNLMIRSVSTFGGATITTVATLVVSPIDVVLDAAGNMYVTANNKHVIYKVASGTSTATVLAGGLGTTGYTNGIGTYARFKNPIGIRLDSSGANLIIGGNFDNAIRKISLATSAVTTLAGSDGAGVSASVNGLGTFSRFFYPLLIALDIYDNIYVPDQNNNLIRKISGPPYPTSQPSSLPSQPSSQPSSVPSPQPSQQPFR